MHTISDYEIVPANDKTFLTYDDAESGPLRNVQGVRMVIREERSAKLTLLVVDTGTSLEIASLADFPRAQLKAITSKPVWLCGLKAANDIGVVLVADEVQHPKPPAPKMR